MRCLRYFGENSAPTGLSPSHPDSASVKQSIRSLLVWSVSDPENDPMTYNVYFGTDNPPPLVLPGDQEKLFDPGDLTYSTTYYWQITVEDDHGNYIEGPVWSFETEDSPASCDPLVYGGQTYATVLIGTQCWMAENLNIGGMISGSVEQVNNGTIEKYCYNNFPSMCGYLGGLYKYNEAMNYNSSERQGICPDGWHIPSDEDWKYLEGNLDSRL